MLSFRAYEYVNESVATIRINLSFVTAVMAETTTGQPKTNGIFVLLEPHILDGTINYLSTYIKYLFTSQV
jgi:hypothetical protein